MIWNVWCEWLCTKDQSRRYIYVVLSNLVGQCGKLSFKWNNSQHLP